MSNLIKNIIKRLVQKLLGYERYGILKTLFKVKFQLGNENEISILNYIIRKDDYCIDIGVNLGEYSYYLSKIVGKEGKVFSFEPFSRNVKVMNRFLKITNRSNVIIINKALSDFIGSCKFVIPFKDGVFRDDLGKIATELQLLECKHENLVVENIEVDCIDNILGNKNLNEEKITFVKCDVEGDEYKVFKGAKYLLEKIRPIILVEIWLDRKKWSSMMELFLSFDYTQKYFVNGKLVSLSFDDIVKYKLLNSFFIPNEKIEKIKFI